MVKLTLLSYNAKPYAGTKYPKTFDFKPIEDWFYLAKGNWTGICDVHENCIKYWMGWEYVPVSNGDWLLKTPIDTKTNMPGIDHMLSVASIEASIGVGAFVSILQNSRTFGVYSAGSALWEIADAKITQGQGIDNFLKNSFVNINRDLSAVSSLDVKIGAVLRCATGGFEVHYRLPVIQVMYVPSTPPQPAVVTIIVANRQTGMGIKGAEVTLVSGQSVIADGFTSADGGVIFNNVPGGMSGISYALIVRKNGYHEVTEELEVLPGENAPHLTYMTPIPTTPLPSWLGYAVLGIGALSALFIVPPMIRRKEEQPIIVVR